MRRIGNSRKQSSSKRTARWALFEMRVKGRYPRRTFMDPWVWRAGGPEGRRAGGSEGQRAGGSEGRELS
eukprot:4960491-Amphidinium_carterae.1